LAVLYHVERIMTAQLHLGIIPARGGSRGITRKNLQIVGGVPLVVRTVLAANASGVFTAVVVSTDDSEIAEVSTEAGATVIVRPEELSEDTSPTEPVMAHALAETERTTGLAFDGVWLLQPTSPFLFPEDIQEARMLLEGGTCDAVVGVQKDHLFTWRGIGENGLVEPSYDPGKRARRQDMPSLYRENGALYAVTRKLWDETGVRVAGRVAPLVMPYWRSQDIDDETDLAAARALATKMHHGTADAVRRLATVQALALDFDGVMTDDKVIVDESGTEAVVCSRRDGMGIARLREVGIHIAVFSTEKNPVVERRCAKLAIDCHQDLDDKQAAVSKWLDGLGLTFAELAYLGNDVNDVECLRQAAVAVVPADAHADILGLADMVLSCRGGEGVVRELAELIVGSRVVGSG
jgi:N-acylneuraminate cytidylyltransferase